MPACTDSTPALSPSHQGHHSAGFDKCHLFLKVALEKGNLTAVRQNREPSAGRPLSTRAQPKSKTKKSVAGPERLVMLLRLALPRDLCTEPKAPSSRGAWAWGPGLLLPLSLSLALCLLLLVFCLVTRGPREPP